ARDEMPERLLAKAREIAVGPGDVRGQSLRGRKPGRLGGRLCHYVLSPGFFVGEAAGELSCRLFTYSWRLFFLKVSTGSTSCISRESPIGMRAKSGSSSREAVSKMAAQARLRVSRSRPCPTRSITCTNAFSGWLSATT